ncbi:MAG: hypothetical protein ACE5D4_02900 [Thermodesulfobacteriota bacterium]
MLTTADVRRLFSAHARSTEEERQSFIANCDRSASGDNRIACRRSWITTMEEANQYLEDAYMPAFNGEFSHPPAVEGSAFVPLLGLNLDDILCEHFERTVGADNCVSFEGKVLHVPKNDYRYHFVKVKVRGHRYPDGSLAIVHGPRKIAAYTIDGEPGKTRRVA